MRSRDRCFYAEVDQASKVSHPNVVRYLGWEALPMVVHSLSSSLSMASHWSQLRGSSPEQFREWLEETCDALNTIHQQGIIHGDLTPNNILIDRSNQAYLSDFGFSQSYRVGPHASVPPRHSDDESPTDRPAIAAGTFGFLAPEQLLSSFGIIGPATDFFALGATAYWYAFGRSIYAGSSQTDFWQSMLDESTIAMPSNENDWLHPFIQNCLIKSVSQRPQSIEELRDLIAIPRD
ncbi:MAG: protein kinase [Pirellulaceae bacterium]